MHSWSLSLLLLQCVLWCYQCTSLIKKLPWELMLPLVWLGDCLQCFIQRVVCTWISHPKAHLSLLRISAISVIHLVYSFSKPNGIPCTHLVISESIDLYHWPIPKGEGNVLYRAIIVVPFIIVEASYISLRLINVCTSLLSNTVTVDKRLNRSVSYPEIMGSQYGARSRIALHCQHIDPCHNTAWYNSEFNLCVPCIASGRKKKS